MDQKLPRSPAVNVRDLLARDTNQVPDLFDEVPGEGLGSEPLDAARYTSRAFFEAECNKLWPKVWQMACREDEIPNPGDFLVYENVGRSFLIVRQEDGSIQAFYNVCLHRGRKLKTGQGNTSRLRCPFHGFTWDLSGHISDIPCAWDFEHLKAKNMDLPRPRIDTWGGFVFVNEDPDAMDLADYLAPLPEHFKRWRYEECFRAVYVGKLIKANWKVVMEAFMEAWHSVVTHPQITPYTGDSNSQYDVFNDRISRMITPFGVMSPEIDQSDKSEQWIVDEFLKSSARSGAEVPEVLVPEGMTARQVLGEASRQRFSAETGYDLSGVTDGECQDAILYTVFPNFTPWGGFMPNIVYRWRPWNDDPGQCLMEVQILVRGPKDQPLPPPAPFRLLGEDEAWTDAEELGALGKIFEQDMGNMPLVQEGLNASANGRVELANYQESRIRALHATIDRYLSD